MTNIELLTKLYKEQGPVKMYWHNKFNTAGRFCYEGRYYYLGVRELPQVKHMVTTETIVKRSRYNKKVFRPHHCRSCNAHTANYFLCTPCHKRQSTLLNDVWGGV